MNKNFYYFFVSLCIINASIYAPEFIFNTPGYNALGELFQYIPAGPNDWVLEVSSSNVILDFQQFGMITQDPSASTVPGLAGILVDPNLSNVTIKNGFISNITGTGIVVSQGCENIVIENMAFQTCQGRAIEFDGTSGSPVNNIEVINCSIEQCGTLPGIDTMVLFQNSNNIDLDTVQLQDNGANGNGSDMVTFLNCSQYQAKNCSIADAVTTTLVGFHIINSSNGILENCTIIGNSVAGSFNGFLLEASSSNHLFTGCITESNASTSTNANGFSVNGSNVCTFNDCRCRSLKTTGTGYAVGFNIQNSKIIDLTGCYATDTRSTNSDAYGYLWSNNSQSSFTDCVAEGAVAGGQGFGMQMNNCNQCIVTNSKFQYNAGALLNRGLQVVTGTNNMFTQNIGFRNGTTALEQIDGLPAVGTTDVDTSVGNVNGISTLWSNLRAF